MKGCTPLMIRRPGGFTITDRALSYCSLPEDATVLDIGCGSGATVNYLRQNHGLQAFGIDKKTDRRSNHILEAEGESVPWPENMFDAVIMECSFTVMSDQSLVLKECRRVLKNEGKLIIATIYARGEPAQIRSSIGSVQSADFLIRQLKSYGFMIHLFEDYSDALKSMWGQMMMDKGIKAFYSDLGTDQETMRKVSCGYGLIISSLNKAADVFNC